MSQETPIEAPNILEKLRGIIGGLVRPSRLYFKNCIQPVVDVSNYGQPFKTLTFAVNTPANQGSTNTAISAFTNAVPGKNYRILGITAFISALGTSIILIGCGYQRNGNLVLIGQLNVTGAAGQVGFAVGGELLNAVILQSADQISIECGTISGAPSVIINVAVQELDAV